MLTARFLAHYAEHYNRPAIALANDTQRLFAEYGWPGNVRELENLVKRAVILGTDDSIRRELAEAIGGRNLAPGPIPALQPPGAGSSHAAPASPPVDSASSADRPPVPTGSLKDIAPTPRVKPNGI